METVAGPKIGKVNLGQWLALGHVGDVGVLIINRDLMDRLALRKKHIGLDVGWSVGRGTGSQRISGKHGSPEQSQQVRHTQLRDDQPYVTYSRIYFNSDKILRCFCGFFTAFLYFD